MTAWQVELCSQVTPTKLDWLWPGYVPRGKLVLLDGDPGLGKSLVTLDLAARLSRGDVLPDGSTGPGPTTTILISAEDDSADTVRPRAEAAGADLNRLVLPRFANGLPKFPEDIPALEELIRSCGAALVVIDPLMAFLPPAVAANLDQCVRLALSPLAALAARTGCSILLVRHLIKRMAAQALRRGQGSMGIVAAVRAGLLLAEDPNDPTARVLAGVKNNVGVAPPTLGFRVVAGPAGQAVIRWTGPVEVSADEIGTRKDGPVRARDRAIDWLVRQLADGPRRASELYSEAAEAGIPERTLRRAKDELPARSHRHWNRSHSEGEWYWFDPGVKWPKDAPFKKPSDVPLDLL